MIPRYGHPPHPNRPYTLRPGAYAILPRDGALLLTVQNPGADVQLPGGGIDPGESPLRALHREVYEETGWHIAGARRLGAFRRFVFMPEYDIHAEKICHIYVARPVQRIGPPLEPDHWVLWAQPEEAMTTLGNAGDRAMVARWWALR